MLKSTQLSMEAIRGFLDELTNEEYRVFFEHFVFKTPIYKIARKLKVSDRRLSKLCTSLKNEKEHLMPLKIELSEAFFIED